MGFGQQIVARMLMPTARYANAPTQNIFFRFCQSIFIKHYNDMNFSFVDLYETDFYAWTQRQVELLRKRDLNNLDIENLIEEIDSLGKQERRELINRLGVLLGSGKF